MEPENFGIFGFFIGLFLFVLGVLWFLLPFAVFGIKSRLDTVIKIATTANARLKRIEGEIPPEQPRTAARSGQPANNPLANLVSFSCFPKKRQRHAIFPIFDFSL